MSKLLIAELSWCNVSLIVVQFQLKPSKISFSSSGFIPIYSKFPQIPMNEQCNQVQSCFSVILWSYSYSCNHFRSIVKPTRVMWGDTRASVWRRKLGKTAIVDSNDGNDSSGGTAQCDRKPESRLVNPAQHSELRQTRELVWGSGMWGPGLYGSGNRTLCNAGYWLSRLATFCQPNIFRDYTSWSAPIFPPRPSTQCARRWQIFIAVCLKIFSWVAMLRVHIFGTGGRNSLAAQFKLLWFVTNLYWHFVVNCPSTQSANIKFFWTKAIS